MKTAGVAIDSWKLEIFERHLGAAGYAFEVKKGFTKDTLLILVKVERASELVSILEAATKECANARKGMTT